MRSRSRRLRSAFLTVLISIAAATLSVAVPGPARADCGLVPPADFIAESDARYPSSPPITSAFFGRVIAVTPPTNLVDYEDAKYLVRVDEPVAGRTLVTTYLSAHFVCGSIPLKRNRTYLFAVTDTPADFDGSFVLESKGGKWVSVTSGPGEPTYLHAPGYPIDQTPEQRAADRVPEKLPDLIRFLQRKLGPLPDTATVASPISAPVEGPPVNPLLLTLPAVMGALLGRRLVRRFADRG